MYIQTTSHARNALPDLLGAAYEKKATGPAAGPVLAR